MGKDLKKRHHLCLIGKILDELIDKYEVEAQISRYNQRYLDALSIAKASIGALSECNASAILECSGDKPLFDIKKRMDKMGLIKCELCTHADEIRTVCCEEKRFCPQSVKFCRRFESIFPEDKDIDIDLYLKDYYDLRALDEENCEALKLYENFLAGLPGTEFFYIPDWRQKLGDDTLKEAIRIKMEELKSEGDI